MNAADVKKKEKEITILHALGIPALIHTALESP